MDEGTDRDLEFERLVEQESLILEATELLSKLMKDQGISKADLARELGKTRSYVSQLLNGGRNMTLRTLADLLFALDHRAQLNIEPCAQVTDLPVEVPISNIKQFRDRSPSQVERVLKPTHRFFEGLQASKFHSTISFAPVTSGQRFREDSGFFDVGTRDTEVALHEAVGA